MNKKEKVRYFHANLPVKAYCEFCELVESAFDMIL